MNAVPKSSAPPSAASIAAALAQLERTRDGKAEELRRTKERRQEAIYNADAAEIRECRQLITRLEREVKELDESVEDARDTHQAALEQEHRQARLRTLRGVEASVAASVKAVGVLHDSVVALGELLPAALAALEGSEAVARTAGISIDPLLLRAKVTGITELLLWLETDGAFGRARTLDSRDELRTNGRADLKRAAAEFQAFVLKRVRAALGGE